MQKPPIRWDAVEARVKRLSILEIRYAMKDILATLPNADGFDKIDGGNRGGYYRDEMSIYRKVLKMKLADMTDGFQTIDQARENRI